MRYVCKNPPGGGTKPLSAHRLFTVFNPYIPMKINKCRKRKSTLLLSEKGVMHNLQKLCYSYKVLAKVSSDLKRL